MELIALIVLLLPGLSFLIFIVACLLVHHRDLYKVHRDGICDRCNYDLTRNTGGVCAECGEPINVSNAPIQR